MSEKSDIEIDNKFFSEEEIIIIRNKREVVKTQKLHPRLKNLSLPLPIISQDELDTSFEVFPISITGKTGYLYIKLEN